MVCHNLRQCGGSSLGVGGKWNVKRTNNETRSVTIKKKKKSTQVQLYVIVIPAPRWKEQKIPKFLWPASLPYFVNPRFLGNL